MGHHVVLFTVYLVPQGVVGAHNDLVTEAALRLIALVALLTDRLVLEEEEMVPQGLIAFMTLQGQCVIYCSSVQCRAPTFMHSGW